MGTHAPAFRIAVLAVLAAACSKAPEVAGAAWRAVGEADLTAAQRQQAERGDRARDALAKALLGELTAAIADRGAAAAIDVCSERAPALAAAAAQEHGVRIGRTAARLRNPKNAAPSWAVQAVGAADGAAEPQRFAGPGGELGLLQPIRLQPQCVQCHGTREQLADGIAAALQQRYPEDRAIGFAPGDLRGWFWVEVPAGG